MDSWTHNLYNLYYTYIINTNMDKTCLFGVSEANIFAASLWIRLSHICATWLEFRHTSYLLINVSNEDDFLVHNDMHKSGYN